MSLAKPNGINQTAPAIQVNDLSFTYQGNETPALQNVHFTIDAGEFVLLAGPSGCGKSTLARCLTGFIPYEFKGEFQGLISIHGLDTHTQSIHNLARIIGLVQQDPDGQIVTLNVQDEIAFGPENFQFSPPTIQEQIDRVLNAVKGAHLKNRSTLTLSGGEKQKIILAAFLAIQPPILILDEPIARLDPPTSNEVISTLQKLQQLFQTTIIVIEHRIAPFLPLATQILLLEKGNLVFNGNSTQLREKESLLTRLGVLPFPTGYQDTPIGSTMKPLLEVQDVSFTYPQTAASTSPITALQNVSFTVKPGEIIVLMGANGSGKTTLMLNIIGLLTPSSGTIHLRNNLIHNRPISDLAKDIGFIFQNPLHQLFEQTVWDELLLTSRHLGTSILEDAEKVAEEWLNDTGLIPYKDRSPFMLSLGEQRRLTIGSVLVHQPKLLLLDEPFIGQDYRNVHNLMLLIHRAINQGTAVLLATHDPAVAQAYCNRLLFLRQGQLLIDAPIAEGFTQLEEYNEHEYQPKLATGEVS